MSQIVKPYYLKMYNMPNTGVQGEPFTSICCMMLTSTATAYAVLFTQGKEEGSRVAFTNNEFPQLTPQNSGTYYIKVWNTSDNFTGFTLDRSPEIIVSPKAIQ